MADYVFFLSKQFVESAGKPSLLRRRLYRTFEMTVMDDYIPRDTAIDVIVDVYGRVLHSKTKSNIADAHLLSASLILRNSEAKVDTRVKELLALTDHLKFN